MSRFDELIDSASKGKDENKDREAKLRSVASTIYENLVRYMGCSENELKNESTEFGLPGECDISLSMTINRVTVHFRIRIFSHVKTSGGDYSFSVGKVCRHMHGRLDSSFLAPAYREKFYYPEERRFFHEKIHFRLTHAFRSKVTDGDYYL